MPSLLELEVRPRMLESTSKVVSDAIERWKNRPAVRTSPELAAEVNFLCDAFEEHRAAVRVLLRVGLTAMFNGAAFDSEGVGNLLLTQTREGVRRVREAADSVAEVKARSEDWGDAMRAAEARLARTLTEAVALGQVVRESWPHFDPDVAAQAREEINAGSGVAIEELIAEFRG